MKTINKRKAVPSPSHRVFIVSSLSIRRVCFSFTLMFAFVFSLSAVTQTDAENQHSAGTKQQETDLSSVILLQHI